MSNRNLNDTICALATPAGFGGISVVRVSGDKAKTVCTKLLNLPEDLSSHRVYFLNVYDYEKKNIIDESLVSFYEAGRSYTNEDIFEISCHGSPVIVEKILQNLILAGARSAERGEFTFRAFMAGKIDLIQAESILSLIESESQKAHEVAMQHLKGDLSKEIVDIKEKMTWILAHLEANIDFSLEDLSTINNSDIKRSLNDIYVSVQKLMSSFKKGKVLSDCLKVSIVGSPNAGKSSLFNQLLNKEKAIVTDIAGTTRDVLEGELILAGVKVKLFDTAGIHETSDRIENLGIDKTKEQIRNSDYIFYVLDKTQDPKLENDILDNVDISKIIFLGNKTDLNSDINFYNKLVEKLSELYFEKYKSKDEHTLQHFDVSALLPNTLQGPLEFIERKLEEAFVETSSVVMKSRQFDLLLKTSECLERALDLTEKEFSGEFTAFELRDALESIFELLGEKLDDNVLDKVFQEFCIGK